MLEPMDTTPGSAERSEPSPLGRTAGEAILRVAQRLTDVLAELAAEHGLTPLQARALRALRDRPSQGRLARALRCTPSRVSLITGELEERGLVTRVPSRSDRRVRVARLTPEGEQVVEAIGARLARESPLTHALGHEELRLLIALLNRLDDADDPAHP
ncbi:DNA-binding transcriptional regulator, MarR family [Marinactinospora thermotolerans DSM 45154]|uniref:DNA-binding transcriptional regulator, MarR family n=2 Tax=Marinactinospora thermotolerans TaxID=531310 RepID=A0A1T4R0Y0_9ACTN|nr:DNA-binding transcriptional regulator, MarR family [Marinactinospora thermotolerans DSM 45154]